MNRILKVEKVERNGRPYWIALIDRSGTKQVEGFYDEFSMKQFMHGDSLSSGCVGVEKEYEEIVESYRSEMYKARFEKEQAQKGGSGSGSSSKGEKQGSSYCVKFLCTIILVLPIWWVIKLPFCLGWGILKTLGYIISWPFRLLMCCCCNTQFVPDDAINWPRYDF